MAKKKLDCTNPLLSPEPVKSEPTEKATSGRPRRTDIIHNEDGGNSAQEGLTADYTRFTVIMKVKNVEDLKDYAYTKRLTLKDAADEILESFFRSYRSDPANEPILTRRKGG